MCSAISAGRQKLPSSFRPIPLRCNHFRLARGMRRVAKHHTGEAPVLSSIGGQNDRWVQIAALQPPAPSQPGRDGGLGSGTAGTATTDLPPINPIAGSIASPLSSDTNFLLTVFGGRAHASNRPGASGSTATSVQDPTTGQSQPTANAGSGPPGITGGPASDGITGNSLVPELQALVASGATATAPGGISSPSARPSASTSGSDAIQNSHTAVPAWRNGWDSSPGPSDWQRQQVGLAAYALGAVSSQTRAAATVLPAITT
jgi:hypothetical protein